MTQITARKNASIANATLRRTSTAVGSRGASDGRDMARLSLNRSGDCSSPRTLEVLVVAARRRTALALVLRPRRAAAVGVLGRRGHLEEGDLADLHLGVDGDRKVGHIRELEREVTVPTCVDEAGGAVNEQS